MKCVFVSIYIHTMLCIVDAPAAISAVADAVYGNCDSCDGEGVKTRFSKIRLNATNGGASIRGGEQSTKCREKDEINEFGKKHSDCYTFMYNDKLY